MAYRKDLERTALMMTNIKNPQKQETGKTMAMEKMPTIGAKPITQDVGSKNYIGLSERNNTGLNRPMKPQEVAFPGLNKAVGKVKMAGINVAKKVSNITPEGVADKARRIFTPNTQVDRYMDPGKVNINNKSDVGDKKVITKYDKSGNVKKSKTITKVSNKHVHKEFGKSYSGVKRIDVTKPGKYSDKPMTKSRYKKTTSRQDVGDNIGKTVGAAIGGLFSAGVGSMFRKK